MFSNFVVAPFVFSSILFLYLAWKVDHAYALWMVPCVIASSLIYIFAPQINWWWYSRRPPKLAPGLVSLLERFSGFYQNLSASDKQKFRDRVALFRMSADWTPMAFEGEEVPPDVQLALANEAVMLTFKRREFVFEKFEKVIVYPRPFSTPEYPFDHASELYEADGCLLFSAEQVMTAFTEPANWYNVGLHEYAKAFVLTYPGEPYPSFGEKDVWEKLQAASGMPQAHIESVIGIAGVDILPVAIHHYFVFPEGFQKNFPAEAAVLAKIFGAN